MSQDFRNFTKNSRYFPKFSAFFGQFFTIAFNPLRSQFLTPWPEVGRTAGSVRVGAGLRGGGGGPSNVQTREPLWGWPSPRVCHGLGGLPALPHLSCLCGHHTVALDCVPQRPHRYGKVGAPGRGRHMAPPPPLLLFVFLKHMSLDRGALFQSGRANPSYGHHRHPKRSRGQGTHGGHAEEETC